MTEPQLCALEGCYNDVGRFPIGLCVRHVIMAADLYSKELAEEARNTRRTEREEQIGYIYFLKVGDRIKVGWAFHVHRRLRQYPPGSEVLAVQSMVKLSDERAMHDRLTQWRIAGREWYRDCPEVHAAAAEIRDRHGEPQQVKWGTGQRRPRNVLGSPNGASIVL